MRIILTLVFTITLASCSISNKTIALAPTSLKLSINDTINLPSYASKYSEYDGVFLEIDESMEHNASDLMMGLNEWSFFYIRKVRYVILNPDNQRLSTFSVHVEANQVLKNAFMRTISPDGKITRFSMLHLKSEKNSDHSQTYRFVYPDVVKGTIVEEGYEIEYVNLLNNPPLQHNVALQYSMPVEKLTFRYAYPDWWEIRQKNISDTRKLKYTTQLDAKNRKRVLMYAARDIAAVHDEPFSPFFKEMADYAAFMITKLNMGNINYKGASGWSEVANIYKNYAIDRTSFFSKLLANNVGRTTDKVVASCKTSEQKLDSIITYLQTQMDVGQGASDFDELLIKKKGNAYLITGLAQAMLLKAGIDAKYLLIHSAQDGYFDKQYFSASEMYTPAVLAVINEKSYVVFPYIEFLPITYIPELYQGQEAIKITNQGYDGFYKVPDGVGSDNITEEAYQLNIAEDGAVEVEELKTLHGSEAYGVRRNMARMNNEERDQSLKKMMTYSDGHTTITSSSIENLSDHRKPLIIRLRYTIDNLVTIAPEEVIFQTGGLFSPTSRIKFKSDSKERKNPIRIFNDETFIKKITIQYPQTWELASTMQDVQFQNNFGSISGNYAISKGTLKAEQSLRLIKTLQPKETVDDLWRVAGKSSRLQLPNLIFKVNN